MLKDIYRYRYFIWQESRKSFLHDSDQSSAVWRFLNPVCQIIIYVLIWAHFLQIKIPQFSENKYYYTVYLISGIISWSFFNEIALKGLTIFSTYSHLLKSIPFPVLTLPLVVMLTSLARHLVFLFCFFIILMFLDHQVSFNLLWLFPAIALFAVFSISVGLIFAIISSFMRDFSQIIHITLQGLFWLTPIVYPLDIISERYRDYFYINPLYVFVDLYHQIIAGDQAPDIFFFIKGAIITLIVFLVALLLFRVTIKEIFNTLT